MPLTVLVALVVLGVGGVILLIHLTGVSRPFVMPDEATARARWLREWPDDRITRVHRTPDGRAALIQTDQGPGLVWSFGADTVSHRVTGATPSPCETGLRVDLHDYAAPPVTITLPEDQVRLWQTEIEGSRDG